MNNDFMDVVFENLGDREPQTTSEAQAVIEHIRNKKGYLDQATTQELRTLSTATQKKLFGIAKASRETESAYTTSISEQLYSSKYRFLYELVQNADDSSYNSLAEGNSASYLRFEVTPVALIVETNEDGFTRANIEAICATGKSSKKMLETDSHIGEKGFGFKSVFSIADEVKVQSGLWSFCFKHRQGDDGLGMVTPQDAPPEVLPRDVSTRITLRYSVEARQEYSRLVDAVKDLPETMIMFLQRLRTMHVNITRSDSKCENTTFIKIYNATRTQCSINRTRTCDDDKESDSCRYFLSSRVKNRLPSHSRRKNRTSATIELAFPFNTTTREPILSNTGYHVFAYLPVQRLQQIQFLYQSDFVTSANRETVADCAWNDKLCEGVAELFVGTVTQRFTAPNHPLRYSWLDYMPNAHMGKPWNLLLPSIKNALKTENVIQTREKRSFKTPNQCRRLPPCTLYNGKPILPDLVDDIYLASEYASQHTELLQELGVQDIGWEQIVDRLQADLANPSSRTKSTKADDPWHEAFADLFITAFDTSLSSGSLTAIQKRIKMLDLIPLSKHGQWTGAPAVSPGGFSKIYFPHTGSTPIPDDLSLMLLEETASNNIKRRAFYKALGVEVCTKATVVAKIKEAHCGPHPPSAPIAHLRYLFRQGCDITALKSSLWAPLTNGTIAKLPPCDLYFPSPGEFDMYQLLPKHKEFYYLSEDLVNAESPDVRVNNESWQEWLARVTGARYYPRLEGPGGTLSKALKAVRAQKSAKFLGTLRAHWNEYEPAVNLVEEELRDCYAPCTSGNRTQLFETYLPTAAILENTAVIGLLDTHMRILKLPEDTLDNSSYRSWKFLEELGVGSTPDLKFYIWAIQVKSEDNDPNLDHIKDLYKSMARLATIEDHNLIRDTFDEDEYPCTWDGDRDCWVPRSQCIFDGPDFISCKTVLARTYGNDTLLNSFFTTILSIPRWSVEDVLQELETRRDSRSSNDDLSLTRGIYTFLAENSSTDEDLEKIKSAFTDKKLILGEHQKWHSLTTCLWKIPFALAGYQDLSAIYGDLKDFFVRRLPVKAASIVMLINEVKRMAEEPQPRIDDIHTRLINVGGLLTITPMNSNISEALGKLKEVKFLPKKMKDADCILVGVTDDFAIPDHPRYRDALVDHDVLLDFQQEEVHILHTMFEQLGLTHRYLSTMVREVSTVGEESREDNALSEQLHVKAYALYCCAAKYKSSKALRGDRVLFEQLSQAVICTTHEISTSIVLDRTSGTLSVQSDRLFIHHELIDGRLHIYVPEETRERRACYRSQLPKLLASILDVGSIANLNISNIISSTLRDLDAILAEEDIPPVGWIEKPFVEIPEIVEYEESTTPVSVVDDSDATTLVDLRPGLVTPEATPRHGRAGYGIGVQQIPPTFHQTQYAELIGRVVRSARQAAARYTGGFANEADITSGQEFRDFDSATTFGSVEKNMLRRIGALGEAYVYELLSNLSIPDFSLENWQSTIRGELSVSTHFSGISKWPGRETADLVYTDNTGALTRYLREHSEGSFPEQISAFRNFAAHPIEYYLEVKSSTHGCGTRFYMSGGQYNRMDAMALEANTQPSTVYVILRVYDLARADVGMKMFVDPLRFKGTTLDFEAEQWYVTAR